MATQIFDRDTMAKWYAERHMKVDPGVRSVLYLPTNAPEREIRFLEVNDQITETLDESLEAFDFGVDFGEEGEHSLLVLDVTPDQWERIQKNPGLLPATWSLENLVAFEKPAS